MLAACLTQRLRREVNQKIEHREVNQKIEHREVNQKIELERAARAGPPFRSSLLAH